MPIISETTVGEQEDADVPSQRKTGLFGAFQNIDKKLPGIGICFALLSCLSFSTNTVVMNVSLKQLGVAPFLTIRYLVLALAAMPGILKNPEMLAVSIKDASVLVVSAIPVGIMTYVGFTSFLYITPVESTAIYNTNPALMVIVATLFLNEKCQVNTVVIIAFVIGSVILITQPDFIFGSISNIDPQDRLIGSLLSFSGGISVTIVHAVVRYVKHIPLPVVIFSQGTLVSLATLLIFRGNINSPTDLTQSCVLCFCAVVGAAGRFFAVAALQREEATIVAAILPLELVVTNVLQILILGIIPNYLTIIGSVILVCSIIILILREKMITALKKYINRNSNESECLLND